MGLSLGCRCSGCAGVCVYGCSIARVLATKRTLDMARCMLPDSVTAALSLWVVYCRVLDLPPGAPQVNSLKPRRVVEGRQA